MSLLGTSLFRSTDVPTSPVANAAPALTAATLWFDIFGNSPPTAQNVTLTFDVPASGT